MLGKWWGSLSSFLNNSQERAPSPFSSHNTKKKKIKSSMTLICI